jgi:hypothetical protein
MLHRLPPTISGRRPVLNEIQPDLHPLEVLFDVKKLIDEQNVFLSSWFSTTLWNIWSQEQPLSVAFTKIYEAVGLYDHWLDVQLAFPVGGEQWAQHAVQSCVWAAAGMFHIFVVALCWRQAGCDALAAIEENVVIAFTEQGGDDNNRITMLLNRAYKVCDPWYSMKHDWPIQCS